MWFYLFIYFYGTAFLLVEAYSSHCLWTAASHWLSYGTVVGRCSVCQQLCGHVSLLRRVFSFLFSIGLILSSEIPFHVHDLARRLLHPTIAVEAMYVPLMHCMAGGIIQFTSITWPHKTILVMLVKQLAFHQELSHLSGAKHTHTHTAWSNLVWSSALLRRHILTSKATNFTRSLHF